MLCGLTEALVDESGHVGLLLALNTGRGRDHQETQQVYC